jgi:hypothetical protein
MANVDPSNNNSPNTPVAPGLNVNSSGYTVKGRGIGLQGYHAGANNNGMVVNTGNVYLMRGPVGAGTGNRSDSGAIVKVIPAGADFFYAPDGKGLDFFSPYFYYLDADNANDGALVTLYSPQGG